MNEENKTQTTEEQQERELIDNADLLSALVEQIAEIRAALAVLGFCQLSVLENQGMNGEKMLEAVDVLTSDFVNRIESELRNRVDLEPRREPRRPIMSWNKTTWPGSDKVH